LRSSAEQVERQVIAGIRVRAVGGERVDLARHVLAAYEAITVPTARVAAQHDDIAVTRRPLALDAYQVLLNLEDHVVTPAFADGSVHVNP
jgi:hypothetical protein